MSKLRNRPEGRQRARQRGRVPTSSTSQRPKQRTCPYAVVKRSDCADSSPKAVSQSITNLAARNECGDERGSGLALLFRMNETADHSEEQSRLTAEEARERTWAGRGFLREIFLGNLRFEWIFPFPITEIRPHALAFLERLKLFLETKVDSEAIDRTGEYPPDVLRELAALGALGMKIPEEFGGLGFTNVEYARALELCAQYDANIVALLSAHQSIGVPQPLMQFGTEAQKRKYLPR